jgi:hypothetical protein
MSTISTPLPSSFDKRPLLIGLGVAGLVVAGVVVAQNVSLPTTTSSTTSTVAGTSAGGPDAIEARQRSAEVRAGGPDALGARTQAEVARVERQLDSLAKAQGNYAGSSVALAAAAVPASVVAQQVGGLHSSYAFTGTTGLSSVAKSQIGGKHNTYAYDAGGSHTVWNDAYVPPYENPEWMPLIQKHYFGARAGE